MTDSEFKEIVMPHYRAMTGIAMALLGDRADAADCLQDSLAKLWAARDDLADVVCIEAYCIRTVRNNALTMLDKRRRIERDLPEIVGRLTPQAEMETKDMLLKVRKIIDRLPDRQREVFVLSTYSGLSPDEVADKTGLSPGNVRTIVSRIRKLLNERRYGK